MTPFDRGVELLALGARESLPPLHGPRVDGKREAGVDMPELLGRVGGFVANGAAQTRVRSRSACGEIRPIGAMPCSANRTFARSTAFTISRRRTSLRLSMRPVFVGKTSAFGSCRDADAM